MPVNDLTRLTAEVTKVTDAVSAAVTLIQGMAQQLRDAGNDQTALDALADSFDAQATALAQAVVANTPAAPTT